MGLPCPFSFRLLRNSLANALDNIAGIDLVAKSIEYGLISSDWLVSTQKAAFQPLIKNTEPLYDVVEVEPEDDIATAQIDWLYKNSNEYHKKFDALLR